MSGTTSGFILAMPLTVSMAVFGCLFHGFPVSALKSVYDTAHDSLSRDTMLYKMECRNRKLFAVNHIVLECHFRLDLTCLSLEVFTDEKCISVKKILAPSCKKKAFEHAHNAQTQITLRMRKVSSGPLLSIYTFCSIVSIVSVSGQ